MVRRWTDRHHQPDYVETLCPRLHKAAAATTRQGHRDGVGGGCRWVRHSSGHPPNQQLLVVGARLRLDRSHCCASGLEPIKLLSGTTLTFNLKFHRQVRKKLWTWRNLSGFWFEKTLILIFLGYVYVQERHLNKSPSAGQLFSFSQNFFLELWILLDAVKKIRYVIVQTNPSTSDFLDIIVTNIQP